MDFNNEKTAKSFIDMIKENPNIKSIDFCKQSVNVHSSNNVSTMYIIIDDEFIPYCAYPTDPNKFEEEYGFPFYEAEKETW